MSSTERARSCLFDRANVLSKLTFWWLNGLFGKSSAQVLKEFTSCGVPSTDEADLLEKRLDGWWKKELKKYSEGSNASLFRAVLSAFLLQWILPGFLLFLAEASRVAQPLLLNKLLEHLSGEIVSSQTEGYLYGFGLACSLFVHAILCTACIFLIHRVALKMSTAVKALLYRKVMSLSSEAALHVSQGIDIELLSTKTSILFWALENLHYLWLSPLQMTVIVFLLYQEVGVAALVCCGAMVACVALFAILELASSKLRRKSKSWREERQQILETVLVAMLQIKVYCLETTFTKQLLGMRSHEVKGIRGHNIMQGIIYCLLGTMGRLLLLVVVTILVDSRLQPGLRELLTSLVLLDILVWCLYRFPVHGVLGMKRLSAVFNRIQTFLLLDEEKEQIKDLRLHRRISYRNEPQSDWAVDVDHMSARWPAVYTSERKRFLKRGRARDSTSSAKSLLHESDIEHAFSLKYLSLQVKKEELIIVIGSPHSGKTSLLMTLLGELPYEIGQISMNGRVAYAGQQPWLFSSTVRENIVFGCMFEASRYDMVVKACCLTKLLDVLPERDQTKIGEGGMVLGDGHAALITLARAIYQNADIYLLDDILRFVDNQTRYDIFKRCICGMLQNKTRIIVTHNPHYLKAANRIAVLREGSLIDIGSLEELQSRGVDFRKFLSSDESLNQSAYQCSSQMKFEEEDFRMKLAAWDSGNKEKELDGLWSHSQVFVFFSYLSGTNAKILMLLLAVFGLAAQGLSSAADWMLVIRLDKQDDVLSTPSPHAISVQTTQSVPYEYTTISNHPSLVNDFGFYFIFALSSVLVALFFALGLVQVCVRSGQQLHKKMLTALMGAHLNFFQLTSAGTILSFFIHHLAVLDTCMPYMIYVIAEMVLRIIGAVVMICSINPWLILAAVPLTVVVVIIHVLARTPVYADFTETLKGLQTVRAFKRQDLMLAEFDSHLNSLTLSQFLELSIYCCLAIRSAIILLIFACIVIFLSLTVVESSNTSLLALSITYCTTLLPPVLSLLGYSATLGTCMTYVEQAMSVVKQEQEAPKFSDKPPPEKWPNQGSISLSNTFLLSLPGGSPILQNINVHIKTKEKVGVVGEPDSGKYSLMAALLRLAHVQGMVFIDGFDVLKIGVHELRKNITVVPKDPVLLPGTLRSNLDPASVFTDDQLWSALEKVGLHEKFSSIQGGLGACVGSKGVTVSLRTQQRQLMCLVRAMLRETKIIIFHEATFSTEHGLDDQVQRILRARFRDCTVIIVAHHLAAVMDCDRIMVFHDGKVKEFDAPYALLQQEDSYFTHLVDLLGRHQARHLRGLAELSQQQRQSASLMLEHAVFMATEQLQASMEDLTFRPGPLAWSLTSKFSKSQDSLEKAHSDFGSKSDIRQVDDGSGESPKRKVSSGLAPSQKIIKRRRSPGKEKPANEAAKQDRKREGEPVRNSAEQVPLLSYDNPPRFILQERNAISVVKNNKEEFSSITYDSSPRPVHTSTNRNSHGQTASTIASSRNVYRNGDFERKALETSNDTPSSPKKRFSPITSAAGRGNVTAPQERSVKPRGSTGVAPGMVVYKALPKSRIDSVHRAKATNTSTDTSEKIIFC